MLLYPLPPPSIKSIADMSPETKYATLEIQVLELEKYLLALSRRDKIKIPTEIEIENETERASSIVLLKMVKENCTNIWIFLIQTIPWVAAP